MAQELVLIRKTRYEDLLSKSTDNTQKSKFSENNDMKLQQPGGQISNNIKKKIFVKWNK